MTPDAYVFGGRIYPVNLQFRYMYPAVLPKCSRRNPCARCYKRGSWWK